MSQSNAYQDLIINNGGLANIVATSDVTSGALQGLQMTNQFAICAQPGSTPLLVPCITPMLLSPQTANKQSITGSSGGPFKVFVSKLDNNIIQTGTSGVQGGSTTTTTNQMDSSGGGGTALVQSSGQQQHFQLANSIAGGGGGNNLPFGISYINLSSLANHQLGGNPGNAQTQQLPIQIALSSNSLGGSNQQFTLPFASITQLTNDLQCGHLLQLSNASYLTPASQQQQQQHHNQPQQIKFESEIVSSEPTHIHQQHQQQQHQQQHQQQQHQQQQQIDQQQLDQNDQLINQTQNITPQRTVGKRGRKRKAPLGTTGGVSGAKSLNRGAGMTNKMKGELTSNGTLDLDNGSGAGGGTANQKSQVRANPGDVDSSALMYDNKGRPFVYECSHCPKKFTQNSRLTAHLRCHSGIRPYTCTQCGFSFTQKSYLIRHAAVHKEDRPFTCSKCLKTYKHYGSLANHRKLHCRESGGAALTQNSTANQQQTTYSSFADADDFDDTFQRAIDNVQMNYRKNRNQQQQQQQQQQESNNNPTNNTTSNMVVNNNSNNNNNNISISNVNSLSSTMGIVSSLAQSGLSNVSLATALPQHQLMIYNPVSNTQSVSLNQNSTNNVMLYSPQNNPQLIYTTISSLPGSGPIVFPTQQDQLPSLTILQHPHLHQQQLTQQSSDNNNKIDQKSSVSNNNPKQNANNSHNNNNILYHAHIKQDSNFITVNPINSSNNSNNQNDN